MAKKIVKKKKWKIRNVIVVLLVLAGLVFGVYSLFNIRVKNIIIKNTTYLNDDMILELSKTKDYPKYFLTSSSKVKKDLEKSPYIQSARLIKKKGFVFEIEVLENIPVFFDNNLNKYVFADGSSVPEDEISRSFRVPRLLNYVPDKKYKKFVEGMSIVKEDTISKISDIEYQPNDYDKDRFLLYMDGNMVYLTLTKFKMINHYNEVYKQLDNHKGILYLDNGNHFQIRE